MAERQIEMIKVLRRKLKEIREGFEDGDCQRVVAGEEGFEPSHAGIKIRCLNQLGDSPIRLFRRD